MMTTTHGLTILIRHYSQLTCNLKSLMQQLNQMSQKNLHMMKNSLRSLKNSIDFIVQSTPTFKPYVKVILQLSDNKYIALTALIDIGVVSSIIHGDYIPKGYHVLTQVSFAAANGDQFYSCK